jgi:protocatechuate 3,4-dioxygenase, beta subunit
MGQDNRIEDAVATIVGLERRRVIGLGLGGAALLGSGMLASLARAAAPTETMTIGPFYPVLRPIDEDADLTVVNGMKTSAKGEIIQVTGRVLDGAGKPVQGAKIEIWQANAAGKYAHPADGSPVPLDDGFQGFGVQTTDAEGRYRFKTIRPAAYTIPDGRVRTPHVHFDIASRRTRIVTQMFFPGEPMNATDFLLKQAESPETLIAKLGSPAGGVPVLEWDIVLAAG